MLWLNKLKRVMKGPKPLGTLIQYADAKINENSIGEEVVETGH